MPNDVVIALEQTWDALRSLLSEVKPDEWDAPTPCSDWTVRDLAAHLGALESGFQGFPQPDPPAGWTTDLEGIDEWTARGVAARRPWPVADVITEIERASDAQLARLRALDDAGWDAETTGPVGPTTMRGLAELRTFDLWIHVLDLRRALGRPLAPDGEPVAQAVAVDRAWTLSGWAAVKKAGLSDGTKIRLTLTGAAARESDLVVFDGKGRLVATSDHIPAERIEGTATAYLLVATGRDALAEDAGGITAKGAAANALLQKYRMFS